MTWPTVAIDTTQADAGTDSPAAFRAQVKQMADNVNAIKDAKDAADGIAGLDSGGKLKATQAPTWPANKGGTGASSFTVGDMFYADTTSTLAKLAAGSTGYVLKSNGAGKAPSWQAEGGGLDSGTRLPLNQTAAPTGWTKDTTSALNDSVMRIVTGTVGSGGSQAFSTFNGLSATGATTLAESQIPPHTHTVAVKSGAGIGAGINNSSGTGATTTTNFTSAATGGGGAHSHSLSLNIKYNDFIIAVKD